MTSRSTLQLLQQRIPGLARLTIGLAVAWLLAGCGALLNPTATSAPPPTQPTPDSASTSGSANPSHATPSAWGDPVATRTATVSETSGSFRVALDLFALRRAGDLVTLNARLRVLDTPEPRDGSPPYGPVTILSATGRDALGRATPDGLALVDAEAALRYLPAVDDEGQAMCSPFVPPRWSTGDEIYLSCIFGAPRSSTVTVDAVTFGAIPDVPVE